MDKHPITPPPNLIEQWLYEWRILGVRHPDATSGASYAAVRAAQWGADQELKAIQKVIVKQAWFVDPGHRLAQLRAARRPKPPSLKEQGFIALKLLKQRTTDPSISEPLSRALEALPE